MANVLPKSPDMAPLPKMQGLDFRGKPGGGINDLLMHLYLIISLYLYLYLLLSVRDPIQTHPDIIYTPCNCALSRLQKYDEKNLSNRFSASQAFTSQNLCLKNA